MYIYLQGCLFFQMIFVVFLSEHQSHPFYKLSSKRGKSGLFPDHHNRGNHHVSGHNNRNNTTHNGSIKQNNAVSKRPHKRTTRHSTHSWDCYRGHHLHFHWHWHCMRCQDEMENEAIHKC